VRQLRFTTDPSTPSSTALGVRSGRETGVIRRKTGDRGRLFDYPFDFAHGPLRDLCLGTLHSLRFTPYPLALTLDSSHLTLYSTRLTPFSLHLTQEVVYDRVRPVL
jgi:hypothetical protein